MFKLNSEKSKQSNRRLKTVKTSVIISALMLAFSIVCYSATAYAWFQCQIYSNNNVIKTNFYSIDVTIIDSNNKQVLPNSERKYELEGEKTYSVSLKASGAEKGYCIIFYNGEKKYTSNISNNEELNFKIIPKATTEYSFEANWGTPVTDVEIDFVENGDTIGTTNPKASHNSGNAVLESQKEIPHLEKIKPSEESSTIVSDSYTQSKETQPQTEENQPSSNEFEASFQETSENAS